MASKKLVAYFSASGVTAKVAERLAQAVDADLFEITPAQPYTAADLDWTDKKSRSTIEMEDPDSRPQIAGMPDDLTAYDTVFIGFPIWWYTAPTIVKTFLEAGDFAGKKIVLFATSGSSPLGKSQRDLEPCAPAATWLGGDRVSASIPVDDLAVWVKKLGL